MEQYVNFDQDFNQAKEVFRAKKYDEAILKLNALLERNPYKEQVTAEETLMSFGNLMDFKIYVALFQPKTKIIWIKPHISEVYYTLGYIYTELSQFDKAIESYDNCIKWNPIDSGAYFEKAFVYKAMGDIEKSILEVRKAYPYIYTRHYIAQYYEYFGRYYQQKGNLDAAYCLLSYSLGFQYSEAVAKQLMYVIDVAKKPPQKASIDEIDKVLEQCAIPNTFYKPTVLSLVDLLKQSLNEGNKGPEIMRLEYILYDLAKDKSFITSSVIKNDEIGIQISAPDIFKMVNKNDYAKYGFPPTTDLVMLNLDNIPVSLNRMGNCDWEHFDEACNNLIKKWGEKGAVCLTSRSCRGQSNYNSYLTELKFGERSTRTIHNFLYANNTLFDISWAVPAGADSDKQLDEIANSIEMGIVWSFKSLTGDDHRPDEDLTFAMETLTNEINKYIAQGYSMEDATNMALESLSKPQEEPANEPVEKPAKEPAKEPVNNTASNNETKAETKTENKSLKEQYSGQREIDSATKILGSSYGEFLQNGVSENLLGLIDGAAMLLIDSKPIDPMWKDMARHVFKAMALLNVPDGKNILESIITQCESISSVRNIFKNNFDRVNKNGIGKDKDIALGMDMLKAENNDKTLKDIIDIVSKACQVYKSTPKGGIKFDENDSTNKVAPKAKETKSQKDELGCYSRKIEGLPTFKFYFPKRFGEYNELKTNQFELNDNGSQRIFVMISKCDSVNMLAEKAKKIIDEVLGRKKWEMFSYNKDKIKDIPIEVYELKYFEGNYPNRIYKFGFVNGCMIEIMGGLIKGKEEAINKAFEMLEWE